MLVKLLVLLLVLVPIAVAQQDISGAVHIQGGMNPVGASSGGTDTYAVTPSPAFRAYTHQACYTFEPDVNNAGACTLNINALGAKAIKNAAGNDPGNDVLVAGLQYTLCYDSTAAGTFILQGAGAGGGGWQDDGTTVRPITTTDEVSVGTSSTYGKFSVEGDSTGQITYVIRLEAAQTANAVTIENSAGTDLLTVDEDGFLAQGLTTTTGHTQTLGNPGGTDTGASLLRIASGDTTAKPGAIELDTADGGDVFAHGGTDDGCMALSASLPGAEGTDCVVTQRSRIANAGSGTDTYTATLVPAISAYVDNHTLCFAADVANDGPGSINFNTLGALPIKKLTNQDLATGDIIANQKVCGIYDGTNFQMTSQLASAAGAADPFDIATDVEFYEEFACGATTSTGSIGCLGWNVATTTQDPNAGEANHPGIYYIATNTSSGDNSLIYLSSDSNEYPLPDMSAATADLTFIVRPGDIVDTYLRVGMTIYNGNVANQDGYYWEFDTSVDGDWHAVTRHSASEENTDTGDAVAAATWYKLRVKFVAGSIEFYKDGVLEGTHTTNLSTGAQAIAVYIENLAALDVKEVELDAMHFVMTVSR